MYVVWFVEGELKWSYVCKDLDEVRGHLDAFNGSNVELHRGVEVRVFKLAGEVPLARRTLEVPQPPLECLDVRLAE